VKLLGDAADAMQRGARDDAYEVIRSPEECVTESLFAKPVPENAQAFGWFQRRSLSIKTCWQQEVETLP
jgi:hypothetical protein